MERFIQFIQIGHIEKRNRKRGPVTPRFHKIRMVILALDLSWGKGQDAGIFGSVWWSEVAAGGYLVPVRCSRMQHGPHG